jgi:hypothetical protein
VLEQHLLLVREPGFKPGRLDSDLRGCAHIFIVRQSAVHNSDTAMHTASI